MNSTETTYNVTLNIGLALEHVQLWLNDLIAASPYFIAAVIAFILFYYCAKILAHFLRKRLKQHNRENFGIALSKLIQSLIVSAGFVTATLIAIPDLRVSGIINWLSIGLLAASIAYKDLLQNRLYGLLILLRQPFKIGDDIKVSSSEGKVESVGADTTTLKTDDGHQVMVPNKKVYSESTLIRNAYATQRSQYDIKINRNVDLQDIQKHIKKAIRAVEGVEREPGVKTFVQDLAANSVTIRANWSTDKRKTDAKQVKSDVLESLKPTLDKVYLHRPIGQESLSTRISTPSTGRKSIEDILEKKNSSENKSDNEPSSDKKNNVSPIKRK